MKHNSSRAHALIFVLDLSVGRAFLWREIAANTRNGHIMNMASLHDRSPQMLFKRSPLMFSVIVRHETGSKSCQNLKYQMLMRKKMLTNMVGKTMIQRHFGVISQNPKVSRIVSPKLRAKFILVGLSSMLVIWQNAVSIKKIAEHADIYIY